jgi:hypothetical protein
MDLSSLARNAIMRQLENAPEQQQEQPQTPKRRGRPKKVSTGRRLEVVDGIESSEVTMFEDCFKLNDLKKQKKLMENALRLAEQKIKELEKKIKSQRESEPIPF